MECLFVPEEDVQAVRRFLDERNQDFKKEITETFVRVYSNLLHNIVRQVVGGCGQQRLRLCDGCVYKDDDTEHCCENGCAGYFLKHGAGLLNEGTPKDLDDAWYTFCEDLTETKIPRNVIIRWFRENRVVEKYMEEEAKEEIVAWLREYASTVCW